MSNIRAIGVDLDGTLFDHRGSAESGLDRFFASLGIEPAQFPRTPAVPADRIPENVRGKCATPREAHESAHRLRDIWFRAEEEQFERWRSGQISFAEQRRERLRSVLPQIGVEIPAAESDLDELFERYLRFYRAAWQLFPDVPDLLQGLRAQGYRLGILTNGTVAQQSDKIDTLGIRTLVDIVCVSEDIGVQKPEAQAFRILTGRLGIAPEQCLFIGDNPAHDIAGAQASGMRAVLIDRYGEHTDSIASAIAFLND